MMQESVVALKSVLSQKRYVPTETLATRQLENIFMICRHSLRLRPIVENWTWATMTKNWIFPDKARLMALDAPAGNRSLERIQKS